MEESLQNDCQRGNHSFDLFEPDVLASLLRQWSRSLRARHRTPRTIETYTDTAERWKRTTVAFRYRSLQQLTN